ncbi:hypothetical protein BH11BAC2_BH11BAC2_05120 [soil metagenome]
MKKNTLIYGSIAGLIVSTFMGISMAIMGCDSENNSGNGGMIIGFSAMVVAFSFVFVGIKNYRDKQNGGMLKFGEGFLLGFLISLVASTMYVLTWAVEFHFFLPDFMDKYGAMQINQMKASGMKGAALETAIKGIETATYNYKNNPFYFAMYTYLEILPVGTIISLISALILKRKATVNL